ncbi:family 16 glycoside hydrolase [Thalassoglobus sp. JC818]|uniref:family 16 glycoside hydrolase n=1 Tax=Thalassoglobus sp. JC818 TaxID=3232136 RepID=UPI00345A32FF
MSRFVLALVCAFIVPSIACAVDQSFVTIDLDEAQTDPDFSIQGEYVPRDESASNKGVQVVALGDGLFRVVIYNGGLPGAGWDRKPPQVIPEEDGDIVLELLDTFGVEKKLRESPTLGATPPPDAIVLFDGTDESLSKHWKDGTRKTEDGLLIEGATTKDEFQDFHLHLEFMTPYRPHARGQARGNSGVYYQGRYETQVLDSFGLDGKSNETGGIYEIRDPDLNMCFPPLTWQTYDVDFTAPRFDEAGQKQANAKITVRLNGVVVQRDVEIPHATRAAPVKASEAPGPLFLQNHGNPVRFRNIWIQTRDAAAEARRPRIPGYERFEANRIDSVAGGQLLVSELGCVQCHASNNPNLTQESTKQAPNLTNVGSRAEPQWVFDFLLNPHEVKPGTLMPDLLTGIKDDEKLAAAQALTTFLTQGGRIAHRSYDRGARNRGEKLFHSIGCVACHAPQDGTTVADSSTVPLPELDKKYSVDSLASFLRAPHQVRPSGRMPSFNLSEDEALDLAFFLAGNENAARTPNVNFSVYHGNWEALPDFDELKPVSQGTTDGLNIAEAGRTEQFGMRFEAYLNVTEPGTHTFWLGSDDGSALYVDGERVIDNDGIHPHNDQNGKVVLQKGVHKIRVDYFEYHGEESLSLDYRAPKSARQDISGLLTLNEDGSPVERPEPIDSDLAGPVFEPDDQLINQGAKLFSTLGCAACHQLDRDGQRIPSELHSKPLAELDLTAGCLTNFENRSSDKTIPEYDLTAAQQSAIRTFLSEPMATPSTDSEEAIRETMVRFNCYACHERNGQGGPELDRNSLFLTTQHEMGDEGRLPPSLNGVGDKLQSKWLLRILDEGSNERPYMLTRMPRFGAANAAHLQEHFINADQQNSNNEVEFDIPEHRVKSSGRQLVGDGGLACIKCHTFGNHQATGIQAIDLTRMTDRIRKDWFLRYLFDPAKYRPGTRMPTGFPEGKAVVTDVFDGSPDQQITAIWEYLSDGTKAGVPDGLVAKMIELEPKDEPIIYRNFLEGVSPRGIAVGYPERAHLAWDANQLCLKTIWHGRFIDASKHWVGRGPGNQSPLGDHILTLEPGFPFAVLATPETPWPNLNIRNETGYQFGGYRLNDKGQPAFFYDTPFGSVTDFPKPIPGSSEDAAFERTLTIDVQEATPNLYFRAAVGREIQQVGDGFQIDQSMIIQLQSSEKPFIRTIGNTSELLVPIQTGPGESTIVQRIFW